MLKLNQQEKLAASADAVYIRAPTHTRAGNQPQNLWVWAGQELIGAGGLCKKGLFVTVAAVNADAVELTNGQRLSHEQAVKCLRLAYALTYASVQGLTLKGVVRLETDSPNLTLKHLYVGTSRATAADLLEVV